MAIDVFRLGHSTGGKVVLDTNPFYPVRDISGSYSWTEGSGLTIDALMTAGEVTTARTPVTQNMADIGGINNHSSRVKVLLSDGVAVNNGSISFDCDKSNTSGFLDWVFNKRKASFSVYIGTENFSYVRIPSCRWNSITASTGEGSILSISISFVSNYEFDYVNLSSASTVFGDNMQKYVGLIPYWQTGVISESLNVLNTTSWELSVSQSLTPQYLNDRDFDMPAYFRTGPWDFNMNVQMLSQTADYKKIYLGVNNALQPLIFTLDEAIRTTAGISFGGLDAMGNHQVGMTLVGKYTNYNDNASKQAPFTINF
jgi:hypothetical protein